MKIIRKFLRGTAIFFLIGIVVTNAIPPFLRFLADKGILQEQIMISGTGSMYPTFPKGEGSSDILRAQEVVAWPKMRHFPTGINIAGFNLFSYKLGRGDIVDFENEKTKQLTKEKYQQEAGFVKRIIGLSGDSIVLRDGFVYLNGQILSEPFTAKARSTYGGDFLPDCQNLQVPENKLFVLGDNRKASLDSRFEVGLVDAADVKYVMPFSEQQDLQKSYRDTSGDSSLAHTATLDGAQFVKLLNDKRREKNLKPLKFDSLLSLSAKRRGNIMITTNDFSTEATRSGVTLTRAVRESGYRNIVFAEVFSRGYFEAEELLANFLEFPQTKNILFSDQYQDIGLSPVLGEVNGCPTQVIVAHLGGYVPPNYKKEDIDSWQKLVDNLNDVLPSWEALKNVSYIDKTKLGRLLVILGQRKDIASTVLSRMRANQWLTDTEKSMVDQDASLAQEANSIVAELTK